MPYELARDVFLTRELPKWEAVVRALPNAGRLPPDCFGALVSLAMNRGDHFSAPGRRYREMGMIRLDMEHGQFADIPDLIRSMRRLWPKAKGLRLRRDHEAALFEEGLTHADA